MLCQVAAKVSNSDEWILANVLSYNAETKMYQVQDEDDANRIIILPCKFVKCLRDSCEDIQRGDKVFGVFPETTSFYRASVVKTPKLIGRDSWEVIVRFDDDDDGSGKSPARRVPARFIFPFKDIDDTSN